MRRRFLIAPILMIGIVLAPAYAGWLEDAKGALEGMGKKGADKAADTAIEGAKGKAKGSAPQEGAQKETGKEASAKEAAPAADSESPRDIAAAEEMSPKHDFFPAAKGTFFATFRTPAV